MSEYNADAMITKEGLNVIRNKPTQFIGTRELAGQIHTAKEVFDNSNDELSQKNTGTLLTILFKNYKTNTYQLLISDTGRGIPVENDGLLRGLTVMNTSGKYVGTAYRGSGGQFGIGGKVPAALSTRFKAISNFYLGGAAQIFLKDGVLQDKEYTSNRVSTTTGTIIIYELDPTFFSDLSSFMESGYLDVIRLFRLWKIFSNVNYIFKISEIPIIDSFWNANLETTNQMLSSILTEPDSDILHTIYDSSQHDNYEYLQEYFNIDSPVVWKTEIKKDYRDDNDRIAYDIKIFATKKNNSGCLGLLNNIFIHRPSDTHIAVFNKTLHKLIFDYIPDKELQSFYLSYGYKLPIYVAMSVKYDKAEVGGTTKDSFEDNVFGKQYSLELKESFAAIPVETWSNLVTVFIEDLKDKYNRFYNKDLKIKSTGMLTLDLEFPNNFSPCEHVGPDSELYIVEGKGAGHITSVRDDKRQAVYCTRGKPGNFITDMTSLPDSVRNLKKDRIYKDIIKIIGLDVNNPDITKLNYGKIILTMDADPDGSHIDSIHIGNFLALNPNLITQGYIWLASPPLYTMTVGKKHTRKYIRDYTALVDSKIHMLYNEALSISIFNELTSDIPLTGEALRDFCYLVIDFGKRIEYSAKLIGIPPLILERLAYGLEYLIPKVDIERLKMHFGENTVNWFVRLSHYEDKNILLLSLEDKDYPVSLQDLDKELRQNILPYIKKYRIKDWIPIVTSKIDNVNGINKTPCTLMQIYLLLQSLDSLIQIDRIKGLGRMNKEDVIVTLMDRNTRSLFHITEIGQIETICNLMGNNTAGRKDLLQSDDLLSDIYCLDK